VAMDPWDQSSFLGDVFFRQVVGVENKREIRTRRRVTAKRRTISCIIFSSTRMTLLECDDVTRNFGKSYRAFYHTNF
jgi:hypothetical protein